MAETPSTHSPPVDQDFPRTVYWGDTHLHTSNSFDAYPFRNETLGPAEAYRFARGETVTSAGIGAPVRLRRPLDWLVVSDHAEYLGMTKALFEGSEALRAHPVGAELYGMVQAGQRIEAVMAIGNSIAEKNELFDDPELKADIWARFAAIADEHDEPGRFTAFIGFEWTSMPGTGDNLHRVVLYRDGADRAVTRLPFSAFDSEDPEDLWAWMAAYAQGTGGDMLAIPHNGNTSNGLMFSDRTLGGEPLDAGYANRRARWEPLYEVTQIKGDGETHPALSPNDEFADFETWDRGNITANTLKEPWMLRHEYARSGLLLGLQLQERLGTNPYRFGLIGSTDAHTGLATADDDNFWGKMSTVEPGPERLVERFYGGKAFDVQTRLTTAAGYTGVWATENTRAALFDAMRRREVYATTGPRITLRFFAGWSFEEAHAHAPDLAAVGYRRGVPMGATLLPEPAAAAPTFLVSALMDPDGATLDRVQLVKGWLDDAGEVRERVIDLAWSGDRRPGGDGRLPPVEDTVDANEATWDNRRGAARLVAHWRDDDFDPDRPAFYYVRILEIPTPRWTTFDAVRLGVDRPGDVPDRVQQRAYSSPIWFEPGGE
jgi:hypothetical protein